jgi:arylsulfatase A-like enzyme
MPNLRKLLIDKGTTFDNSFVTNSLCCPSRATILRGQYTHNHQILSNEPPLGGFEKFRYLGHENSTMATWLKEKGYRTAFFGKYLNGYNDTYIPPGWDEWYAQTGNYLSNDLNENGHIVSYDPGRYHLDDVLSQKASDYITRTAGADPPFFTTDRPFLMYVGTKAPHQPATPAARDEDAYPHLKLPHPPNFDEKDVSDKPDWISDNPPLSAEQKQYMEELHRKRLQDMLAVDDMIGNLVEALRKSGDLKNTYIFFTSDQGGAPPGRGQVDGLRGGHPRAANSARPGRAGRQDPAPHGPKQRPRPDVCGPRGGQDALLRGRTFAETAAQGRPDTGKGLASALRRRGHRGA